LLKQENVNPNNLATDWRARLEDIRLLQVDQANPNVTTIRQQEQIWISLLLSQLSNVTSFYL